MRNNVSLASLTSLRLGGFASQLIEIETLDEAIQSVLWSRQIESPLMVLGGGTNLVISDEGWRGLVLQIGLKGIDVARDGESVLVTAAAGESWDDLVAMTVGEGLAGIECLSGIPGSVGATPIQNVGAYGQEVASVIERVQVLDLESLETKDLSPEECDFAYRLSMFRRNPSRYLVTAVTFNLVKGGAPTLAYRELRSEFEASKGSPPLTDVREAVMNLRRGKSMVIDENDPNRRSVGSFFVNPVVEAAELEVVQIRARAAGIVAAYESVPSYEMNDGRFKLSAGWLVEKAGFAKGLRRGAVGISSAHALALINLGGGTATDLVELAKEIRGGVFATFGIKLRPEPVFFGFPDGDPLGG